MLVALIILVLVLVAGFGLLIFWLQRRSQTIVPRAADEHIQDGSRVVSVDDEGRPVTEAEDPAASGPHDDDAFARALEEQKHDLHPDGE